MEERLSCADCAAKACDGKGGKRPEFCLTDNMPEGLLERSLESYHDGEDAKILRVAATVEHDGYLKWCRVQETIEFARRMGYRRIGIATCVALLRETRVLASILNALKSIVNVMGMEDMNPPIRDLLPRLTPILRNRNELVQENCVDLVGRIADRGPEFVPPKEWSRICFDLLDLLNAKKKSIRRTAVNTFGYIAKALGPQDVMYTLLNNLKVQERQNRLCTSIAIAIVAESCSPFTVLPALMNEYRLPEMNVQNGVLKAMSFMFEYIGETASNYIYACIPVLEDALMDRDLIHRQQASAAISHLAVGVYGEGCEDGIQHLLNYVFPNIFEISPHLNKAVLAAIESCRLALGPPVLLMYVLQGLFHPARRVREVYWKIYNNLYIYGADALTMAYPQLEDDGVNTYHRDYIEMFISSVCKKNKVALELVFVVFEHSEAMALQKILSRMLRLRC